MSKYNLKKSRKSRKQKMLGSGQTSSVDSLSSFQKEDIIKNIEIFPSNIIEKIILEMLTINEINYVCSTSKKAAL